MASSIVVLVPLVGVCGGSSGMVGFLSGGGSGFGFNRGLGSAGGWLTADSGRTGITIICLPWL